MAEAVTYAELRFTKPPPWNPKPLTSDAAPSASFSEMDHDGEITYANINISQTSPEIHRKQEVCAVCQTCWTQNTRLILALSCLFLLATTMGLVGKLFQVSQSLKESTEYIQQISHDHENLSSSLALRISTKEATLSDTEQKLRETEQELDRTKNNLQATFKDLDHIQQQLVETTKKFHVTEETLRKTQENLSETMKTLSERGNTLQETQERLRNTESALTRTEEKLRVSENTLLDTKNRLRTTESHLSSAKKELNLRENSLSRIRGSLRTEQQRCMQMDTSLRDLKEKWSNAQKCLFDMCSQSTFPSSDVSERFKYCPSSWILLDEKCYFFSEEEKARIHSEMYCTSENSQLVSIKDSNTELKGYVRRKQKNYWIGLSQGEKNIWKWSDGTRESLSYSTTKLCTTMGTKLDFQTCSRTFPWICEKESSECEVDGDLLQCVVKQLNS
uniref:C-type lectin domain family 4 member M-like n=1 Tax=Geotrypetes seraphini TaxID=260995 RepID=A0A6P8S733_GEOSA|nr:C-type lectin domain family 4 member M-like [Geotrypetes seraphini]